MRKISVALSQNDLLIRLFEHGFDAEDDLSVLQEILKYYQVACYDKKPERVDQLFDAIDTDCVQSVFLGGLLRYAVNFARGNLNNWYDFRERAIQSITRRGEDPADALYGLLDDDLLETHEPSDLFSQLLGLSIEK